MLTLRDMTDDDVGLVRAWLGRPHVATWYLAESTIEDELLDVARSVAGEQPTRMLVVLWDGEPAGWCQWYLCADYPDHAARVGAEPGDVGIDYAIGEPGLVGRGVGTELIAALVGHVRALHPGAGIVVDPDAENLGSRGVLEKNGFRFLYTRGDASTGGADAIYRLDPAAD